MHSKCIWFVRKWYKIPVVLFSFTLQNYFEHKAQDRALNWIVWNPTKYQAMLMQIYIENGTRLQTIDIKVMFTVGIS